MLRRSTLRPPPTIPGRNAPIASLPGEHANDPFPLKPKIRADVSDTHTLPRDLTRATSAVFSPKEDVLARAAFIEPLLLRPLEAPPLPSQLSPHSHPGRMNRVVATTPTLHQSRLNSSNNIVAGG